MMKYQNVSNNPMFTEGTSFPIKIKKELSLEDWEKFEEIADSEKKLWDIFWHISKDKKTIKEKNICALFYLEDYVFPHLGDVMKSLVHSGKVDNSGLSIILSLFLNMIPKDKCQGCDCEMDKDDWIKKV